MAPRRRLRLERTLGPVVIRWMEGNLVHGPGDIQGQRFEVDDDFARFLFGAYELDDAGRRLITRAVYSRPKGYAKSERAAALACVEALGPVRFRGWDHDGRPLGHTIQTPYVKVAATEEGQGEENMYEPVYVMLTEGAVSRTPGLDVGKTRTNLPDGGRIIAVSARAASKDGGKETFAVFDETHLYVSPELRRLHSTIRRNLMKRRAAQPWALETSTMYAPGENSVAESAHAYAKRIARGEVRDRGFLFDHRGGPDPKTWDYESDEELMAALLEAYGPAAAYVDLEQIVAEARRDDVERSDVLRYFVNVPAKREQASFIRPHVWDGRAVRIDWGEMAGLGAALGADGSRTWDTTVVAWAVPYGEKIRVGARIFSVRPNVAHHVLHEGGKIDYGDVEDYIVDRFDYFDVREAAYDPRYLERSAEFIDQRLPESSIIAVEPTSKHMREALGLFERLVLDDRLEHDGDPQIAAHLANTRVERGERNEVRRVAQINQRLPIDAVPAMALACWRAVEGEMDELEPLVAFGG